MKFSKISQHQYKNKLTLNSENYCLQYYELYHNTMTLLWLYYSNLQVCKPTVYLQVTTVTTDFMGKLHCFISKIQFYLVLLYDIWYYFTIFSDIWATLQYLALLEYISFFIIYFFWMVSKSVQECPNKHKRYKKI